MSLTGWDYKSNPLIIPGSTDGEKYNYPVEVIVPYFNNITAGEWKDARFTASDEETLLDHALLDYDDDQAIFLVKLPYLPESPGSVTIYCFSGNPEAEHASNYSSVTLLRDDFESGVIDTNKWNIVGSPSIITTDYYKALKLSNGNEVYSKTLNAANVKIYYKLKFQAFGSYGAKFDLQYKKQDSNNFYRFLIDKGSGSNNNRLSKAPDSVIASNTNSWSTGIWYTLYVVGTNSKHSAKTSAAILEGNSSNTFSGGIGLRTWDSYSDIRIGEITVYETTPNPPSPVTVESFEEDTIKQGTTILKTLFEAIRPFKSVETIFSVKQFKKDNLITTFCVRKRKSILNTFYEIKTITDTILNTIYQVKISVRNWPVNNLSTIYTINNKSAASKLSTVFVVNGIYIKDLKLHGTILDAYIPDRNKPRQNKQVKVIIGGNIYV